MNGARARSGHEPARGDEEREIEIDVIDVLLPCRNFAITYKVADLGKVSLTSEFLMRLVHSVEGIPEGEAAAYFGFSDSEIAFVVSDLEALGYLERREGSLWLTLAGRELFKPGSDTPEIYEVERRSERHGFDLIALAPTEYSSLSPFDAALPELPSSPDRVANASHAVRMAFRRHFDSLVRRATNAPLKQSLYSVDSVTALNRYATPVPVRVRAKASLPGIVEPDLSEKWTRYDLDDRTDVVESAAAFLKACRITSGSYDDVAFQELARVAPDALADYYKDGAFRRGSFYREAIRRAGDLRADRPTILLVGTLFTDRNGGRLKRSIDYAVQRSEKSLAPLFFWHPPGVPSWGATRRLPLSLDAVRESVSSTESLRRVNSVGITHERPPRHLDKAFDSIAMSQARVLRLESLEVFLIPDRVAAVLVHVPATGSTESYPVPLGILSFDPDIVYRTTQLLSDLVLPLKVIRPALDVDEFEDAIKASLRT
ncbi:MAG: hypothetical protein JO036_11300 [Candidatus Eremiobacteraeota bacterium]|nr:hypothetical protein [Candidatus Eremiobacteraeota bacterium]